MSVDNARMVHHTGDMKTSHFIRHGKPTQQLREGSRFVKEDVATRFYRHVKKSDGDGCWEWIGFVDKNGYGKFTWEKGVYKRSHRVAWVLDGNPELDPSVYLLHSCDNPACVRPSHLRPGTQKENIRDMDAKCRRPKGEKHHSAVLTNEIVRKARAMREAGMSGGKIAKELSVSRSAIDQMLSGKTWRHVV